MAAIQKPAYIVRLRWRIIAALMGRRDLSTVYSSLVRSERASNVDDVHRIEGLLNGAWDREAWD